MAHQFANLARQNKASETKGKGKGKGGSGEPNPIDQPHGVAGWLVVYDVNSKRSFEVAPSI